uniref:Alpha-galactosidase n=1 Tax=Haptolina brevifila TaxID=156173 RepID=A0A7S2JDP7_9EUKA
MDGMVRRNPRYTVDGKPTSLCDLGYCDVGLDDNWQKCGKYGAEGYTYHNEDGSPLVNHDRFPSMKNMTSKAHSLGLTSGWYGNNCICSDSKTNERQFYEGDVKAMREFGFDSWKLDGCGAQTDMALWDELIKASAATTGRSSIMVENCHWGSKVPYKPTADWCPWNFYRTSGDVRANYGSVVGNLDSTVKYSSQNLSYPGCWAYPDMLEVGVLHTPFSGDKGLTMEETRSHFGSWVIVSSPLTLSHDVNNQTIMDAIWPIISNKEVLAVSQSYAGHSGSPFKSATEKITLAETNTAMISDEMSVEEIAHIGPLTVPVWQYFYKPMAPGGDKTAVLLMNHASNAADLILIFSDIPGVTCSTCKVRDLWKQQDIGTFSTSYTSKGVVSHDSVFLLVTPS